MAKGGKVVFSSSPYYLRKLLCLSILDSSCVPSQLKINLFAILSGLFFAYLRRRKKRIQVSLPFCCKYSSRFMAVSETKKFDNVFCWTSRPKYTNGPLTQIQRTCKVVTETCSGVRVGVERNRKAKILVCSETSA